MEIYYLDFISENPKYSNTYMYDPEQQNPLDTQFKMKNLIKNKGMNSDCGIFNKKHYTILILWVNYETEILDKIFPGNSHWYITIL